ncbi:ATP-dependent DNA ligase [Mesorhizobium sp. IMUNJ 23232]|uniref:ATP-dependent DNA ligase n=1 Tax=Mesorhizobium sp. IMUNJ 23232 TaxID=3376064 RepID=UPI00379F83A6
MRKRSASGLSFIEPMLPTLVDDAPEGDDWIREVKFDGYRSQLVKEFDKTRIFTRNGFDWSAKYAPLIKAAAGIDAVDAIIDGEIIVFDLLGKPNFKALRSAITREPGKLVFIAFDLLHLSGHDLRGMAVEDRRALLADLIEESDTGGRFQFSAAVEGTAEQVYRAIDGQGLEGMVSKRMGSPYESGRVTSWLKVKCYDEGDFKIVGVQRERGKPAMALMADGAGKYVGGAFVTLPQGIRKRLWDRVQAKAGATPPKGLAKEKAEWVKPGLVARVKFLKGEQKLRHATVKSFREGKLRGGSASGLREE